MAVTATGSDRGATRFEAVATVLAAWILAGIYLVGWALTAGQTESSTFSPYHLPAYLGLIALAVVVAEHLIDRSARGGLRDRVRAAWAGWGVGERMVVAGTAAIVAYVVLDIVWVQLIGIGSGVEGRQAPTRHFLVVGLGLVAANWLVAAPASGRPVGWLGVVGFTTLLALGYFWLGDWHPVYSPMAGRVDTRGDLTSEVWTMAPDGSTQTRVVEANGFEASQPAWSPDGNRIVYVVWTPRADGSTGADLWTAAPDGSDARQLTSDAEWDWIPAWSPDGTWIAFTSREAGTAPAQPATVPAPQAGGEPGAIATGTHDWAIYLIHPDGTERHRLVTGGESLAPTWSPDGVRLAYHGSRDGTDQLFVANADGSAERQVTTDQTSHWSPTWSPDGTQLVYVGDASGNDDVWRIGVDGTGATDLTNTPAADQVPVWSPDGRRIAFVSDRTGDPEIWSIATDGSDARNLSLSPDSNDGRWSVSWSSNGARLAYARSPLAGVENPPTVREDLGFAGIVLTALLLALVMVAIDGVGGLPRGGVTVVVTIATLMIAAVSDGWRFVPAAIVAGIIGDLIASRPAGRRRRILLASTVPMAFALGFFVTIALTGGLAWSLTLALGAVVASALIGAGVALLTSRWSPAAAAREAPGG